MKFKKGIALAGALLLATGLSACGEPACTYPPAEDTFYLALELQTEEPLAGLHVEYYLGETPCGGRELRRADGTALEVGETANFDFLPADFPEGAALSQFCCEVFVIQPDGAELLAGEKISLAAEYGKKYEFCLTGSAGEGYQLRVV